MKITGELKSAIRAVCDERNAQAAKSADNRRAAVKRLIEGTPRIRRLFDRYRSLRKDIDRTASEIAALGLRTYDHEVCDITKARAAGLKFDEPEKVNFDRLIAQIACADKKRGEEIVKSLGIRWE